MGKGARLDLPKLEGIEVTALARYQAIDVLPLGEDCGVAQEKESGLDPPHTDDRLGNN